MDAAMNALRGIPRVYLKDCVFISLVILFVLGPLEYVASFIPTLWSLPAIFIISGAVWTALEAKLSRQPVKSDGKAVFISGCDSGFGFELAKRMANKGFHTYAGCLFPEGEGAKTLSAEPNVFVVGYDVTKEESIAVSVAKIEQKLRNDNKILWGVVANAGIAFIGPLNWHSMDEIMTLFDVNVFGVLRTVKAFLPLLEGSGGRFVTTGSVSGLVSAQFLVAYSMTKSAVRSLTEGLRRELGGRSKVYFTSVMPSFYRTPIFDKASTTALDRQFDALPPEEQHAKNREYLDESKRLHRFLDSVVALKDLSGPLRCFEHALTSTRPQPYYICDRPLALFTLYPIVNHFPIETTDFLLTTSMKLMDFLRYFMRPETKRERSEKAA